MRIVVVDDELSLLAAIRRTLSRDHEVLTASSGAEAIPILLEEQYDVVLCDLMLPDIEGAEIYARVIAEQPELEPCFVFMTGGAHSEAARSLVASMPHRCLSKPFDEQTVAAALQAAVEPTRRPPLGRLPRSASRAS